MYKQNRILNYMTFILLGLLLNISPLSAQDINGSYSYKVSKDGYEATVKLYVYEEDDELYGRLRIEGNQIATPIEANLWTMKNGNYTDFFYEAIAGDNPFTSDTHIFTLSGEQKKTTVVFGKQLKEKVNHMQPATIFQYDGKTPTFKIKDKGKSTTIEVKEVKAEKKTKVRTNQPENSSAVPIKAGMQAQRNTRSQAIINKPKVENIRPILEPASHLSETAQLLIGEWKGTKEQAEYVFEPNGKGTRNKRWIKWALEEKGVDNVLVVKLLRPIGKNDYEHIKKTADTVTEENGVLLLTKDNKTQQLFEADNKFWLVMKFEYYNIQKLTDNELMMAKKSTGQVSMLQRRD